MWMTGVKRPGDELAVDEPWQVEESGLMTPEDYDTILAEGWVLFQARFLNERIRPGLLEDFIAFAQSGPAVVEMVNAADVPYLCMAVIIQPFEPLCGGRTFTCRLDPRPVPHAGQGRAGHAGHAPRHERRRHCRRRRCRLAGSVGRRLALGQQDARAPAWDRFVWPYVKELVTQVHAAGLIPILHFDSDWTRDLPRLLELPARSCILSLRQHDRHPQGEGGRRRPHVHHGRRDPHPPSSGTADQVYDHCRKLIADIGPTGFIRSWGCDIPVDAPLANVKAMADAAADA